MRLAKKYYYGLLSLEATCPKAGRKVQEGGRRVIVSRVARPASQACWRPKPQTAFFSMSGFFQSFYNQKVGS